jgi:hypothetical protein
MQFKAVEAMVDTHRRELREAVGAGTPRHLGTGKDGVGATQRSAAGVPVPGGRAVRRAVAPRLGTWLIHAGVRLGGASARAS